MKDMRFASIVLLLSATSSRVQALRPLTYRVGSNSVRFMSADIPQTTEEWKNKLNVEQFEVLRRKATEPPGYSETETIDIECSKGRLLKCKMTYLNCLKK